MFNKFFWMIALVLLTAGSIFIPGMLENDPSASTLVPETCENCTLQGTEEPVENYVTGGLVDATPIPEDLSIESTSSTPETRLLTSLIAPANSIGMPFIIQPNSPVYMENFAHVDTGCSWSGVAGQVFGSDGEPLTNIIVRVTGRYNSKKINRIGITGMQAGLTYGPGSYEIKIGSVAKSTRRRLKIQLFSLENKPISAPVTFRTYSDCKKNLAIINFLALQGTSEVNPTPTKTLIPTLTLTPAVITQVSVTPVFTTAPSKTSTPIATRTSTFQPGNFSLQPITPVYISNFVYSDSGCAWQGVAGQVFDKNGNPLTNLVVKITGKWNGNSISKVALTGMATGLPYGPGSFEIILGNAAAVTDDTLGIQVFDSNSKALTDVYTFDTYSDCSKNLVIINFKQY